MTAPLVPDDAYDAAVERFVDARAASGVPADVLAVWADAVRDAVDAAAPLIRAAEARRHAETVSGLIGESLTDPGLFYGRDALAQVVARLHARITELEAGAS